MNKLTTSLFAVLAACSFAIESNVQAQSPARDSDYSIDQAGISLWNADLKPHLVIRPPVARVGHHANHAVIAGAAKAPVWKQPYAYGYFGVKPHRLPYRSFGHQQAYTEWRWR